jgi:DNA-binding transcriptional LysR family regulator
MVRDELSVLSAFLTVAEERSFTRAAKGLGVSTSALSHPIRGPEERYGVHLLARTTRSVAPTHAGEQLIARLRPASGALERVLEDWCTPYPGFFLYYPRITPASGSYQRHLRR